MATFAELGLTQPLVDTITKMGFEQPTPIQEKAIPELLKQETDLVGLAQTGTGKTAAFGLPLMDLTDAKNSNTQALVLAPTRELCLQISKELERFAAHLKQLKIRAVYGGTDIVRQIKDLRRGAHIVVATPGRLRDMIKRKAVNLGSVDYVVLDEADEMLNMGFKEEIDEILESTPEEKSTWLFSATMPSEVRRIAKNYMTEPLELTVGERNTTNTDISHQYVTTRPSERYEVLRRYLDFDSTLFGLVFTRTRRDSKEVAERLAADGYNADALHGDLSQAQRDMVMERFRKGRLRILVATDVAARGIDVSEITHVFHYNIPEDISFYTHRAGRTGRAGKKGISLVLMHPKDYYLIKRLEKITKSKFELAHIPTGQEICEQNLMSFINKLKDSTPNEDILTYLPKVATELEELSKEELIEKLTSLTFNRFLKKYRNTPDLNARSRGGERRERNDRGGNDRNGNKMKRFFINVGSMDVDGKAGILSLLCSNSSIEGRSIGKIDIADKFTFFDVEEDMAEGLVEAFEGATLEGRSVRLNEAEPRRDAGRRGGGGGGRFRKGGGGGRGRRNGGGGGGRRRREGGGGRKF